MVALYHKKSSIKGKICFNSFFNKKNDKPMDNVHIIVIQINEELQTILNQERGIIGKFASKVSHDFLSYQRWNICSHHIHHNLSMSSSFSIFIIWLARKGVPVMAPWQKDKKVMPFPWTNAEAESFALNSSVNVANEHKGRTEAYCAKHQEECIAHAGIVAENKWELQ